MFAWRDARLFFVIAVYTSIFGSYDPLHYAVRQSVPTNFYAIVDEAKPHQGWKQIVTTRRFSDPRMEAKWYKVFPDKLEFDEDYVIWVDGSIRITSAKFVEYMVEQAGDTMAAFQHPWRTCIYEEARECHDMLKYRNQPILAQVEHYRDLGWPENGGLIAGGVICWKRSYINPRANQAWWEEMMKWSLQDQLSFPIVASEHGLEVNVCNKSLMNNEYFQVVAHHRMEEYEKVTDSHLHNRIAKP
ncbi:DUF616 domain-containing protein [bacterium]|nr:DUF616 domain-containing protein [bacterium]